MSFAALAQRAGSVLETSVAARYGAAALSVLAIVLLRAVFEPAMGPGSYYYLYYPAILIVAYTLGLGPSLLVILLGAFVSYYAFVEPEFTLKGDPRTNLRLVLFVALGCMVALLAAHVRSRFHSLSKSISEASALSRSQADLFREHAERVGNHLQLLSALLQLRARDEPERDYARVLMNAASRTLLISRLHRSFASPDGQMADFAPFAGRLADAALEARGSPPLIVAIDGELPLLPEHATSLALVLLECINARANQQPRGAMRVTLALEGAEAALTVVEDGVSGEDLQARDMHLVGAIAEQMNGRIVLGSVRERGMMRFVFPTALQPPPPWDPLTPLH